MAFTKTHQPCLDPLCGSSDGLAYNEDGSAICFVCNQRFKGDRATTIKQETKPMSLSDNIVVKIQQKHYPSIVERGLSSDTCKQYSIYAEDTGYTMGYYDETGALIAVKQRTKTKEFKTQGDWKEALLFGQHLYSKGGRYLTITEGEMDAAAAYQMMGSRYPVVSIKNGAGSALKDCKAAYEYIDSFENIIVCFDSDEVGQRAAMDVVKLFGAKAKIVKHSKGYKDACDYLGMGDAKLFNDVWWKAEHIRLGKVVDISDFIEKALTKPEMGLSFPWPTVTKACFGIRPHTVHVVGAAPKIGKTDHEHQLVHHLVTVEQVKVGMFDLENHPINTAKKIASKEAKLNFLRPDIEYETSYLRSTLESLEGKVRFYDREGSRDWNDIRVALLEMHFLDDINIFVIDPITALISRYSASEANDKLNEICTEVADIVSKYPITIFFYSHVNPKPKTSKPHEAGGRVLSSEFTGSRAMEKWFHYGHGISRDRTEDCPDHLRNVSETYMLFDRDFGQHYKAYLYFDETTVNYLETEIVEEL